METEMPPITYEASDYNALAILLAAIPAPRVTKDPGEIGKKRIEPAKHVPITMLLHKMREAGPEAQGNERHITILATALTLLKSEGAIEVTENRTVAATTEAAGHLFRSLGHYLKECAAKVDCYQPVRLNPDEDDPCKMPFLILARQAEEHRIEWIEAMAGKEGKDVRKIQIEPIREQKVISVLVKGERTNPAMGNGKETVFLHVWKEGWKAYALIGSEQISSESRKDTAYRALKEDLRNPSDNEIVKRIKLSPFGIEDVITEEYSETRGAYTRYTFGAFWVDTIDGELKVEEKLMPRWFTFDEIRNQKAITGEKIITQVKLLEGIDVNKVPSVISNVRPFDRPLSKQIKDLLKEIRDVGEPLSQLVKSISLIILSVKWWFLLLIAIVVGAIFLPPIIDEYLPGLSTIADVLSIVGFLVSLTGLAIELRRSSK